MSSSAPEQRTTRTPIEWHDGHWVKRDDTFEFNGARGGKVRSCLAIATQEPQPLGLVTAGSRSSPQCHIVAVIGKHLGLPVRLHMPQGESTPEILAAEALGAVVVRHYPGRESVLKKR